MFRTSSIGVFVIGALAGALVFGVVRLVALPPLESVHYHANWALWIDGERVDLSADRYMEDVAACAADAADIAPHARIHMHENDMDVVHVHHAGATWGHLLQNIGWGMGADWLRTDDARTYVDGDGGRFTYILNGLPVPSPHDRVVRPGDRLLISHGTESADQLLSDRFPMVASDATEFDLTYDPAGCAGTPEETFGDRVRRAFWF